MMHLSSHRKFSNNNLNKYLPNDAECKTIDSEFTAVVQLLSAKGVVIITNKPLAVGQEIAMTIKFQNNGDTVKATGEIVQITSAGVGVEFKVFFNK